MAGFNFEVLGVPQLIAKFVRAAVIAETGMQVINGEMAQNVVARAKELVPVDSGALQAGIHAEHQGLSWVVIASSVDGGADKEYAKYVEYGTYKMSPRPFLNPALQQVQGDLPPLLAALGVKIVAA